MEGNSGDSDLSDTDHTGRVAMLLIAHGSRRKEANQDLEHFAALLRERGRYAFVQCSYLEMTEPTIVQGGEACAAEADISGIIMLPWFLSAGVHVRDDLTEARATLQARFPAIAFRLAEPFGRHPLLLEIAEQRASEAAVAP